MTVGQQKQKWTIEEESALRSGVEKYGSGKWRAIQKDEVFGPILVARSNVDLKDKWRNISATASGNRNRAKGTGQKARRKADGSDDKEDASSEPDSDKKMLGTKYDNLIFTAIGALKEPDGSSFADIAAFIEESQPVPPTFKKLMNNKLKSMVLEGKLVKVQQNYKINGEFPSDGRPSTPRFQSQDDKTREITKKLRTDPVAKRIKLDPEAAERRKTAEEAARVAAKAVAAAEAAAAAAEQAAREAEAAEQESEAAQLAAEMALAAARHPKKQIKMGREAVAVSV